MDDGWRSRIVQWGKSALPLQYLLLPRTVHASEVAATGSNSVINLFLAHTKDSVGSQPLVDGLQGREP